MQSQVDQKIVEMVAFIGRKVTYSLLLTMVFISQQALAEFAVRNYNPFALGVGLPQLQSAKLLAVNEFQFDLSSSISSQFVDDPDVFVDAETQVHELTLRYRFEALQLSLSAPWVRFSGGGLDGFVESFHGAFGFPNGGRDRFQRNRLRISYGQEGYLQEDNVQGIGNVHANIGMALKQSVGQAHSVFMHAKLPTSNQHLLTSGGIDVGLSFAHEFTVRWLTAQLQYGGLYLGRADFLQQRRKDFAITYHFALSLQLFEHTRVTGQVDGHTALFDRNDGKALAAGTLATIGIEQKLGKNVLKLAVLEDIAVDTVPDVGFLLSLSRRFE